MKRIILFAIAIGLADAQFRPIYKPKAVDMTDCVWLEFKTAHFDFYANSDIGEATIRIWRPQIGTCNEFTEKGGGNR